jgi:hypothetical protein
MPQPTAIATHLPTPDGWKAELAGSVVGAYSFTALIDLFLQAENKGKTKRGRTVWNWNWLRTEPSEIITTG